MEVRITMNIKCINYFKEYNCLASDCVNDCCHGWTIEVEPETIEKWQNKTPQLLDYIQENSYRTGTKCMKSKDDRSCIMLSNGLCDIHKNHEAEMLPNICNYFPQLYKRINKELFLTATVSCPAIAKLIVNDNEDSNFLFSDFNYDLKKQEESIHETLAYPINYDFIDIYEFLIQEVEPYKRPRYFLMTLYYLSEILDQTDIRFLGDLYERLYEISNPQIKKIYFNKLDESLILSVFRSIKELTTRSKKYISQIISYVDYYLDNPDQITSLLDIYLEVRDIGKYDKYLRRFIKAKLSETIFPFCVVNSVHDETLIIINEVIILELMIVIFSLYNKLDEELVANLIHSIDREFYGKKNQRILETLDDNGMCNKYNIFSFLI